MKKIALFFAAALVCGIAFGQETQRQRLENHLYTLASDSLRGREAGTEFGHKAADYILGQWRQMGLKPLWNNNFEVPFKNKMGNFTNLVAVIEGSDPVLKNEYIVLGAHYDHLGVRSGKVYNGADDNASGSACLMEIARQLLARRGELKRSVIICAFDAEEMGLFGSKDMVIALRRNNILDKVKLMMSVDMVGWYKANGALMLEGTGTIKGYTELLSPDKLGLKINVKYGSFENSMFTATDTEPFAREGIPTLAVNTGLKSPYHKPEDDADLIDYEGLDLVTNYIVAATIATSQREGKIASGRLAAKHRTARFEAGVGVGYNLTNLVFPKATFTGKANYGLQGGLQLQYNASPFVSFRTGVMYDYSHFPLPAAGDAYGPGFGTEQHSMLVPLTVQLGIHESGMHFYFGLGMYYGYSFKGGYYGNVPTDIAPYSLGCDPHQLGWVFNFGMRLGGSWQLDGTWYNQLTDFFDTSAGMPKALRNTYAVTVSYWF